MSMANLQGVQSPFFAAQQSMELRPKVPPWLEAFMPRKGETPFNQFMNTLMNPKGNDAGAELKAYGQLLKGLGEMMQGLGRLMNARPDCPSNAGPQPHSGLGQILAAIVAAAMQALQALQSLEDDCGNEGKPPRTTPAGGEPGPTPRPSPKGAEHSDSRMTRVTKETTTTTTTVETNTDRSTAAPGRAAIAAA